MFSIPSSAQSSEPYPGLSPDSLLREVHLAQSQNGIFDIKQNFNYAFITLLWEKKIGSNLAYTNDFLNGCSGGDKLTLVQV